MSFQDFADGFTRGCIEFRVGRQGLAGKQQKKVKALISLPDHIAQRLLLQPVCFAKQPFDAVAVHGQAKLLRPYGYARLQHGKGIVPVKPIYYRQGTGMHTFTFPEQRLDPLAAF